MIILRRNKEKNATTEGRLFESLPEKLFRAYLQGDAQVFAFKYLALHTYIRERNEREKLDTNFRYSIFDSAAT